MLAQVRPALVLLSVMTVLLGLVYPLAMTGLTQVILPHQANGSLLTRDGKVIGSALIGQNFTGPTWFHGRPSATTDADPNDPTKSVPSPYNAAASGGSNLGPTSETLIARVKGAADGRKADGPGPVPVDLVTTSASGLDPDITPAAAMFQVPRVAQARNLPEARIRALVEAQIEGRLLGFLGEPRVNVLRLNLALEGLMAR